jgi:hypothetical protein
VPKIPIASLLLLLFAPGCVSASLNNSIGGLFSDPGDPGQSMLTYSTALEAQGMPCPGFVLGGGVRLLGAHPDAHDPHWQFHLATGYSSWRMPGRQIVAWEATLLLGGGWVPPGNGEEGEPAFTIGGRFSLPIRVYPPAAPLWRLDRLTSIVIYVVPSLSYSAAYLPGPDILRHEVVHGVGLRFQFYSAVLP